MPDHCDDDNDRTPHDVATVKKVALLILSLGLDTFAVALAGVGKQRRARVASSVTLFEGGRRFSGFVVGR